jgi:hypothetical protein
VLWLALLAFISTCSDDDDDDAPGWRTPLPDTGGTLPRASVRIPADVSMNERNLGAEGRRYDFSEDGRVILGLYLGPNPSFNPMDGLPGVESEFVGGLVAKTVVAHSGDVWSRDMLVQSRQPVFYYFFYRNLSGDELATADDIIGSLRE